MRPETIPAASVAEAPSRLRRVAICLSLANLCFLPAWANLLDGWHSPYFEKYPSPPLDALAAILDVLALAAILACATFLLLRLRWRALARWGFLALFLVAANDVRQMVPALTLPVLRERFGAAAVNVALASAVVLAVLCLVRGRVRVLRFAEAVAVVLLPFVLACFGWAAWRAIQYASPASLADGAPSARRLGAAQRRVVWIIFDEMDQRLAFAERPAGLALPGFDRLRTESLFAENAYPPANHTLLALPSLLTGKTVTRATPSLASELDLTSADGSRESWKLMPGIFGETSRMGVASAVVGWYHPYCRMFGALLQSCTWLPFRNREASLSLPVRMFQLSMYAADSVPLLRREDLLDRFGGGSDPQEASAHRQQFAALLAQAEQDVSDPSLGFVFVHLPLPHDPSMYDRRSGQYDFHPSRKDWYLDNLAYSDKVLGDLRAAMEAAGLWQQSAVLISSDHPWRRSEQYDGKHDPRVPFLLKLAGQEPGSVYAERLPTIVSAPLVLAILRGELSTTEQLRAWLSAQTKTDLPAHSAP